MDVKNVYNVYKENFLGAWKYREYSMYILFFVWLNMVNLTVQKPFLKQGNNGPK